MTIQTPALTKRIGEYDRDSKDFPAYVVFEDGREEYIGSRPTQHDASLLASDYIIQFYQDAHTPEVAASLIMREVEEEGRHEQLAQDMGGVWEVPETAREIVQSLDSVRLEAALTKAGALLDAGELTLEAPEQCECGALAVVTIRENGLLHTLCDACFKRDFQDNENRVTAWLIPVECANCRTDQLCYDDGAAYVCIATKECRARQKAAPVDLSDEEAIRVGAGTMLEAGITACTACGGRHHPQRCPLVGALLWMERAECLSCGTEQPCLNIGIGHICIDQAACEKRVQEMIAAVPSDVLAAVDRVRERVLDEATRCPSCGDPSLGLCPACRESGEAVAPASGEDWEWLCPDCDRLGHMCPGCVQAAKGGVIVVSPCTAQDCRRPATKLDPIGMPVCDECEPIAYERLKQAIFEDDEQLDEIAGDIGGIVAYVNGQKTIVVDSDY